MSTGERFDRVARALATPSTRRRALLSSVGLLGGAGFIAAWRQPGSSAQGFCLPAGAACAMGATCCEGTYCAPTSLYNPNVGVCTEGSPPESSAPAPTPKPTRAPRPTKVPKTKVPKPPDPLDDVRVRLQCAENDAERDVITIENLGLSTFSVTKISALPAGRQPSLPLNDESAHVRLSRGEQGVICVRGDGEDPAMTPAGDCLVFWDIPASFFVDAATTPHRGIRLQTSIGPVTQFCEKRSAKRNRKRNKQANERRR